MARAESPPPGLLSAVLGWVAPGFGAGGMAAALAYAHSPSPSFVTSAAWAVGGTLAGAVVISTGKAVMRDFGIKTQAEWLRAASPAQRREHRIAVTLGWLLVASALGALIFL